MGQKKILLAEDDLDDQELFFDFLLKRGDVDLMPIVDNGVALIEYLSGISEMHAFPDLIVLDQNMPLKNGIQTLQYLKTDTRYRHIPVIIYSTYTDDRLVNTCSSLGASGVFTKPFTKEGYENMINDFLIMIG